MISLPVLTTGIRSPRLNAVSKLFRRFAKEAVEHPLSNMLKPGNSKLGAAVWHFSLPAGLTCPTMTPSCLKHCYAINYSLRLPGTLRQYVRNYTASLQDDFPARVAREIRKNGISLLRLHVSGEFYSQQYLETWLRIFEQSKDTRFFFYTRAWRSDQMLPTLLAVARQSNVRAWFSCDRDSGIPKRTGRVRIAYMAIDSSDVPAGKVDLVFRVRDRKKKQIRVGPTLVCPVENGTIAGSEMTCIQCRICFDTAWKRNLSKSP